MKKKKKGKEYITATNFVFACILIIITTVFITSYILRLLFRYGLLTHGSTILTFIYFIMTDTIIGTILATIVAKKFISPIVKIANALNRVAKGDYNVTLNTKSRTREVVKMTQSFNVMTSELRNTELIHSDFIANVSHEIKTPLSAIEGYATLLQKKNLSDEKKEAYTEKIINSTKRLSILTENVLLLSKLENQQIEIQRKAFCLDEQIREIVLLFENEWTEKQIEMDIQLEESVDYYGNAELLSQVWQNLISNAIKFTQNSGQITISMQRKNNTVKVSVKDNGEGMSESTQKRLFEKFYQGDVSHTAKGNGLGLPLVKKIVDLHNGEITLTSAIGKGTDFVITLPIE